jgi:hypothetical protein
MQQEQLVQRDCPARLEAQEPRVVLELPVLLDHLEVKVFLEDLAQPESLDPLAFLAESELLVQLVSRVSLDPLVPQDLVVSDFNIFLMSSN